MLFPETIFVNSSIEEIIKKVREEADECIDELIKPGRDYFALAMELNDVCQAAETALRKLERDYGVNLERAYTAVLKKVHMRGHYV